jgi:O-antigen/teichoic acid export membrane protein
MFFSKGKNYLTAYLRRKMAFDARSIKQYKNIGLSFFFKSLSFLSSFALVPLYLNYLSKEEYGTWLTIASIIGWTTFFDLGLGSGMKNKLSTALAQNDMAKAKQIVSTTYVLIGAVMLLAMMAGWLIAYNVNWNKALNAPYNGLSRLILVCLLLFCLRLVFDLINCILYAYQQAGYVNFISFLQAILLLVGVFVVSRAGSGDKLFQLGIVSSAIPLLVMVFFNIYLFARKYKSVQPSFLSFNRSYIKEILSLGSRFFLIQIIVLIVFSTDSVIISKIFEPAQVAVYNSAYKLFSVYSIVWILVLTPYSTAFNESYIKNDSSWIRKTMKQLSKIWIGLMLAMVVMLLFVGKIYSVWFGNLLSIPFSLSFCMSFFVVVSTLGNTFSYFLNGIGKVKVQLYAAIFSGLLNIPVSVLLAKYTSLGINGVVIGSCLTWGINPIIGYIQYKKITNNTAKGIWLQ